MSLLQPVKRARRRSLWLQEALAREPEAETVEPLSGGHRTDVCIVGGGYTGLWTALQFKWLDPSVEVMLLEADICGGGASGRNGGFATSWWEKLNSLVEKYGEDEGMRLARESAAAVAAIGRACADYRIDTDFRPGGVLITATAPAHIGAWNDAVRATRDRGIDVFTELAPAEVARRAGWYLGP
jgi:glycine/D-amino acid oxidase-like deaminating enzyme